MNHGGFEKWQSESFIKFKSVLEKNVERGRMLVEFNPTHKSTAGLYKMYEKIRKSRNGSFGFQKHNSPIHNCTDGNGDLNLNSFLPNKNGFNFNDSSNNIEISNLDEDTVLRGRYQIVSVIGEGTFSKIVKVVDMYSVFNGNNTQTMLSSVQQKKSSSAKKSAPKMFAMKIMNKKYNLIGVQESNIVSKLNKCDIDSQFQVVKIYCSFIFQGHVCLVMELLESSLLEEIQSLFSNLSPKHRIDAIRKIAIQLIPTFEFLKRQKCLHADLKPENIVFSKKPIVLQLKSNNDIVSNKFGEIKVLNRQLNQQPLAATTTTTSSSSIQPINQNEHDLLIVKNLNVKLIDFGNSFFSSQSSAYFEDFDLQSMYYKAPEILFGTKFDEKIDMWSLGCVFVELFLGKCLFPATSKQRLPFLWSSTLGPIPSQPFENSKFYASYFPTNINQRVQYQQHQYPNKFLFFQIFLIFSKNISIVGFI